MPALPDLTQQALQTLQRQGGVLTSAELQAQLGVSQPTVSRALAPLIQSGQVQKVGAARSQRYVLPRTVRDVGRSVPVLRIDLHGQPSPFARMVPLAGGAVWIDEEDGLSKRFDGLPWFLDDMRPQGFMGRTFATSHPELQLGNDPRYWSDDDVLRALALCGDDLPGNLVVGEASLQAQLAELQRGLPEVSKTAKAPPRQPRGHARRLPRTGRRCHAGQPRRIFGGRRAAQVLHDYWQQHCGAACAGEVFTGRRLDHRPAHP